MNLRVSRRARWLLLAAAVGILPAAIAFNVEGKRWRGGQTTLFAGMSGVSASGASWSTVLKAAMQQWTDKTDFNFVIGDSYGDPCAGYARSPGGQFPLGGGDGRNGADFRNDVCGNAFGDGVLAITLTLSQPGTLGFGHIVQADIIFNSKLNWDVYSGPLRRDTHDFGRVALHELGHVLGLDHDPRARAIMTPTISALDSLQPDDIAGVNVIYGQPTRCNVAELPANALVRDSLAAGDCRVLDLYGAGVDTSFVDVYRLRLAQESRLRIAMQSGQLDSVLILTDANLNNLHLADDSPGTCDAHLDATLPAGEYLLLANTYDVPRKCVGNTGPYTLAITDTTYPQMGLPANTALAPTAAAWFHGGATADGGTSFRQQFGALEEIAVAARIALDPRHVGLPGKVYVLAVLGDGTRYAQNSQGAFVRFDGALAAMPSRRAGSLQAEENITVINGLQGQRMGLAGQSFAVYVGYALDSDPQAIHFGSDPIRFSISR